MSRSFSVKFQVEDQRWRRRLQKSTAAAPARRRQGAKQISMDSCFRKQPRFSSQGPPVSFAFKISPARHFLQDRSREGFHPAEGWRIHGTLSEIAVFLEQNCSAW